MSQIEYSKIVCLLDFTYANMCTETSECKLLFTVSQHMIIITKHIDNHDDDDDDDSK